MLSDLPANISTFGSGIDSIMSFIWWTILVWFIGTELVLFYLLFRYRKRDGVRAKWMPGDTLKANMWVLIPAAIVLVFDLVIETKSHAVWQEVKGEIPKSDMLIRITGRQFAWTFTYTGADGKFDTEDDFQTTSVLHVPMGKKIVFELESVDVLHSFFVPAMRLKQDAVPGRRIKGWFEVTRVGDYEISCAELCGPAHGSMRAVMTVHKPDAFAKWAAAWSEQRELLHN